MVVLKRTKFVSPMRAVLIPLPSDATCQLNVFRHDCDPLRMDGTKVGVLEEAHQISLRGLLQGHNGPTLEPDVNFAEVLSKFPHQPLEWQLSEEELRRLLVPASFMQGHCARSIPMRFLHALLGSLQCLPTALCFFALLLRLFGLGLWLLTRGLATTL